MLDQHLNAIVFLAVAGCSQPHAREAPPPRPRDAATPTVVDANLVDAVIPADAPRPKVLWQNLRDRDEGAANVRVAARVVQVLSHATDAVVVFDRGKYNGVQVGWKGSLVDGHDYRVFDVFAVTQVDNHSSQAVVRANVDQVNGTSMHAVLWDPGKGEH